MKLLPKGVTNDDINRWITQPTRDARTWRLKIGAPSNVVDAFPKLIELFLVSDHQPAEVVKFDKAMPIEVDMADPSTLFVRIWQLAGNAGNLRDEAIAIGLDKPLASHLAAHAEELELLRDQVHDALLTEDDKSRGAIPRAQDQ